MDNKQNFYSSSPTLHLVAPIGGVCSVDVNRLEVLTVRLAKANGDMPAVSCSAAFAVPTSGASSHQ